MTTQQQNRLDSLRAAIEAAWKTDITRDTRKREVAEPRGVFWYIAKHIEPRLSFRELAEFVNRTNHATVINGIHRTQNLIDTDQQYREMVIQMMGHIGLDEIESNFVLLKNQYKPAKRPRRIGSGSDLGMYAMCKRVGVNPKSIM